jgi:hypothetical protein
MGCFHYGMGLLLVMGSLERVVDMNEGLGGYQLRFLIWVCLHILLITGFLVSSSCA